MPYIGDIYIPALSELSVRKRRDNAIVRPFNSDPRIEELQRDADSINIRGFLVPEGNKSEDDFAEDLFALIRNAAYNHLNYADKDGFVAVEGIDAPKTAEINLREFNISGRFFPRTVYQRAYKFTQEVIANDFGIGFPAVIPLPVGATNVRLKSPWQTIVVQNYWAKATGRHGDILFYQPYQVLDVSNYSYTNGDLEYDPGAYKLQNFKLNAQNEKVNWTLVVGKDIPIGTYKVKVRVKDSNVSNDVKVVVSGTYAGTILEETFTTGSTDYVLLETSEFMIEEDELITIEISKATTTTNSIYVNYCYFDPTYTAKLLFDVDQEYDAGEVAIYDDMNSNSRDDWVRVYNPLEHEFVGNIVIMNNFFYWRLDPNRPEFDIYRWDTIDSSWYAAGSFQFRSSGNYGRFDADIYKTFNPDCFISERHFRDGVADRIQNVKMYHNYGFWVWSKVLMNNADIYAFNVLGDTSPYIVFIHGKNDYDICYRNLDSGGHTNGLYGLMFCPEGDAFHINLTNREVTWQKGITGIRNSAPELLSAGDIEVVGTLPFTRTLHSNLFKEAEDAILSAGAYINRFIDDFSADSSDEYTVLVGTGWSWDTVNGELDAYSDTETKEVIQVNALKFASGTYEADIRINTSNAVNRYAAIAFGIQDSTNFYFAGIFIHSTGVGRVRIWKRVNGSDTVLADSTQTINVGTSYHIKIDWDPSTGQIDLYFDGAATPTISAIDTTFSSGYAGFCAGSSSAGTGNVDESFDNLDIQAEETTSSGNSCVIFKETNEGITYSFTPGTDLPLGRYLAVYRVKDTAQLSNDTGLILWNGTDGTNMGIDGFPGTKNTTVTGTYTYYIRPFELGSDDEGDNVWLKVKKVQTGTNTIVVDYFLIIPISLLESQQLGPQDLAFLSMVDPNLEIVLEVKS